MKKLIGNNILIVDQDLEFVDQLRDALSNAGASCFGCHDLPESMELLQKYDIEFVICNYYLPSGIIHQLSDKMESFLVLGFFEESYSSGQFFRVQQGYMKTWLKLIKELSERQIQITGLLNKVAGF